MANEIWNENMMTIAHSMHGLQMHLKRIAGNWGETVFVDEDADEILQMEVSGGGGGGFYGGGGGGFYGGGEWHSGGGVFFFFSRSQDGIVVHEMFDGGVEMVSLYMRCSTEASRWSRDGIVIHEMFNEGVEMVSLYIRCSTEESRGVGNPIITSLHIDEQENKLGDEKNCRERKLVPSCFVIYDLELLSLSFDFMSMSHVVMNLTLAGMKASTSHLLYPEIKQLAIKRMDEYGFVIHSKSLLDRVSRFKALELLTTLDVFSFTLLACYQLSETSQSRQ
ncbi:hypothetical protein Tco_1410509 [Tanacetum coccineum]